MLAITSPVWLFMFVAIQGSYENAQKKKELTSRTTEQFEHLIEICKHLASEYQEYTYLDTESNPCLPADLKDFGFYNAMIQKEKVTMGLFSSFDSGGQVVCDWSGTEKVKLYLVEGDYGDIITPIYKTTQM